MDREYLDMDREYLDMDRECSSAGVENFTRLHSQLQLL